MNGKVYVLLLSSLLSSCASAPDLSNDPRTGGFFGGVAGLARGDYEARQKERQDLLARLRASNRRLEAQNAQLRSVKKARHAEVRGWERKLGKLEEDLSGLREKTHELSAARPGDEKVKELTSNIAALNARTAELKAAPSSDADLAGLEARREKLEQEYEGLLQIYLALHSVDTKPPLAKEAQDSKKGEGLTDRPPK